MLDYDELAKYSDGEYDKTQIQVKQNLETINRLNGMIDFQAGQKAQGKRTLFFSFTNYLVFLLSHPMDHFEL